MPGMTTQLYLEANKAGIYRGSSANISGPGFASMVFTAKAESASEFNNWTLQGKSASQHLSQAAYQSLAEPGTEVPADLYSNVENNLFNKTVFHYLVPAGSHSIQGMGMH